MDTVAREVASVDVSGSTVTLTLASAVVGGETVLVSYDSSQAVNVLQDTSATSAADLTNESVKNHHQQPPRLHNHHTHGRGEHTGRRDSGGRGSRYP